MPFKDEWGFQLGYFQSFVYTISFMSLLFSISLPIISIFAVLFFFLRYYIEKYNFLFVYEKEFESKGLLKMITNMQIIQVICFQLINFSLIDALIRNNKNKQMKESLDTEMTDLDVDKDD